MADVLLFHHALGVTPGIEGFADRLRSAGHRVQIPDLFDGRRFDVIEDGVAYAEEIGFDTVINRGVAAAEGLNGPLTTIGFSLGVLPAQKLAQTNAGVTGAVLCHAAVPLSTFGDRWPQGVRLHIHLAENDPWAAVDIDAAHNLVERAQASLFLYDSSAHLAAEAGHDHYDPVIADQIIERTLAFLGPAG